MFVSCDAYPANHVDRRAIYLLNNITVTEADYYYSTNILEAHSIVLFIFSSKYIFSEIEWGLELYGWSNLCHATLHKCLSKVFYNLYLFNIELI